MIDIGMASALQRESQPRNHRVVEVTAMRVMLVDNDWALLRSLQIHLEQAGHKVAAFADPRAALERLGDGDEPDVIVLDYVMPAMNGIELARRLLADHAELRILFVSGSGLDHVEELKGPLGRATLIGKPFSPEELTREIRKILS